MANKARKKPTATKNKQSSDSRNLTKVGNDQEQLSPINSFKIEARETVEIRDFSKKILGYIVKLIMLFLFYSAIFLFDHFLFWEVKKLTWEVVSRHTFLVDLYEYVEIGLAMFLSLFAIAHGGLSLVSQIRFDLAITRELDKGGKL